ncbi:CoA enzyme activase uncharacterised domain [Alkalithermobacter thermoalcaliphilus JW-YL-7 = DSM 7308]|uniref:CoA enzyme activase uncharacterized domain n=1 Tax=Alkalithermobacter thermoalcaliphilus JW-YL-7 = DSM 7308 TaxID=1121328 RepID=A0A150FPW7_CLOPD|nr:Protein of unknown function DUF2229, CoA enzyme activase [[Clostridium] paradoxum JW-YL-7 = DSM 7308]SHK65186.1 CoA enzyme activase uncharacterised domain [[Clostridium] paradoxum JW-YL-7 = DSM 7308]
MSVKIGIPKALLFHKYSCLWTTFFEELGAEVIVSDNTNKKILDQGTNNTVDEACIPIKLFHGHVLSLKDKVDYIFMPRILSLHKKEYICPNNLYDKYMNMNSIDKIKAKGDVLTPEMIDKAIIDEYSTKYKGKIFWSFARKLIGSTLYLVENNLADGVIYISSFGCGIDSVVEEIVERIIKKESNIPYMLLTLDEHSGEAGINTRLEAFIDMIKWRDTNENNISAHG